MDDKRMVICGVDLGNHGALAWLDSGEFRIEDMPVAKLSKTKVELDVQALYQSLLRYRPTRLYVEKLQAMPPGKGGSSANFSRGQYMGVIRALTASLGISLVEVAPQTWQKTFKIKTITADNGTKDQAYLIASRLYPEAELKTARGAIKDGRCDALLIATYGRRIEIGGKV